MFAEEMLSLLLRPKQPASQYTELNVSRIIKTLHTLELRILERFPGSGISQVCAELRLVGAEVEQLIERMRQPIWMVRIVVFAGIGALLALVIFTVRWSMQISAEVSGITELIQSLESAINEIIFLAIAIFFLGSLETRIKRYIALRTLHRLRSIAHVIDMHQLTKDPVHLLGAAPSKVYDPKRFESAFELNRYLDYCSELLSITSKLAAIQAQYLNDSVVLNAVNDIENLSGGLSNKIWQKIMMLDMLTLEEEEGERRREGEGERGRGGDIVG